MTLSDFLRGQSPTGEPDELLLRLLTAVVTKDEPGLTRLCAEERDAILARFPEWKRVPEEKRRDRDWVDQFVRMLFALAEALQRHGIAEPMQRLTGGADNPLVQWQRKLEQARGWMEEMRFPDAVTLLNDLLIDVRGLSGTGADAYLPVTYGCLGECYFQSGDSTKAVIPTRQALTLCQRSGDIEGQIAYLGNLYEMHRYLGQAAEAADAAEQLAGCLEAQGQHAEAGRYRRQALLVRTGEPLNRIVCHVEEKRYELHEILEGVEGRIQFVFERNRLTLRPAQALNQEGGKHGSQSQYEEALGCFRAAADADRFDPQCHYEAGLTLLYLRRYAEACEEYRLTEELAPGWFHCRSDLWLAEQLAAERYRYEIFVLLRALEDGPIAPAQKVQYARRALAEAPELAALYLELGRSLKALTQAPEAEKAFRQGLFCAEDDDVRTRLLTELASVVNDAGEKRELLRQAVALNGNLVAAATARLVMHFEE
jgi:tetratricopeptide (TPR) repeat protein